MLIAEAKTRVDVLHVEDDAAWTRLVQRWLTKHGLTVHHVPTGSKLLEFLDSTPVLPRCLLLDIVLRDGDGLDLCDRIKRSPRLQSLPIIVLTGINIDPVEVLKHQALYRVEKGMKAADELVAVIDSILTQQRRDQGVVDAGDVRLDPTKGTVYLKGEQIARLAPGPFSAFSLLTQSAPGCVEDDLLYRAFLSRRSYKSLDHELTVRHVLRNYVSLLRRDLGKPIGERIMRDESGYAYKPRA